MRLVTLAAFSVAAGIIILLVFKIVTNRRALKTARGRLRAHLLAIRLFGDDPALILRSQGCLLLWTVRYVALLLPAFIVIAIPLYFAWDHLDCIWGRAAFAPGDTTLVTARLRDGASGLQLAVPDWLLVESPPVRAEAEHEVSWRLRVLQARSGDVSVGDVQKRVEARPGLHYLPDRERAASGPVEWVEIRYPRASSYWVLWFFAISTLTALALRGKLRVTF